MRLRDRIKVLDDARISIRPADLRGASNEQLKRVVQEGIRGLEQQDPDAPSGVPGRTNGEVLAILRDALEDVEVPHAPV